MNWIIIKKQLLVESRSFGTYIWLLFFPLAMMLVLGNVLTNAFNDTPLKIKKVSVVYKIPKAHQPVAEAFSNFAAAADSRYISFNKITNKESALKQVKRGNKTALTVINKKVLTVYSNNPDILQSSILSAHLQGFTEEYAVNAALLHITKDPAQLDKRVPDYTKTVKSEKTNGIKQPSSFQYYAIAMIALSCLMTMIIGTRLFSDERERKTMARMYISPVPRSQIIISNFFGSFVLRACSLALLMVVVNKFFTVSWGKNVVLVFFSFLSLIMFAMLLGITIDIFSKGAKSVTTVANIVVQTFLFFGGAYFPVSKTQALFSPVGWVLVSVREMVYSNQIATAAWPIWALLALSSLLIAACVSISHWRGMTA
ncbi:ABC transporter permease [Liquorilactobacillus oeni]|uniref:ABC transporter n=1 Tax=Liquorilactobacillus oeni DSM 19972 TaxID=1423777 RepID=A0A0R1MA36_9LACO|nr:ABC transporter permease [Liquorilactobacillus oeni]KRL05111.1 ABC transporter [Liquorilactobacillus oeni DSM 19972]